MEDKTLRAAETDPRFLSMPKKFQSPISCLQKYLRKKGRRTKNKYCMRRGKRPQKFQFSLVESGQAIWGPVKKKEPLEFKLSGLQFIYPLFSSSKFETY